MFWTIVLPLIFSIVVSLLASAYAGELRTVLQSAPKGWQALSSGFQGARTTRIKTYSEDPSLFIAYIIVRLSLLFGMVLMLSYVALVPYVRHAGARATPAAYVAQPFNTIQAFGLLALFYYAIIEVLMMVRTANDVYHYKLGRWPYKFWWWF